MKPREGSIQVIETVPGASRYQDIIARFDRGGSGIVTALSDPLLLSLTLPATPADVEFLTFGEAVGRFATWAEIERLPIAPTRLIETALESACARCSEDAPLRQAGKFVGIRSAIWNTLHDLDEACIDIDQAAGLATGTLAAKLQVLSTLNKDLAQILRDLRRTTTSKMMRDCLGASKRGANPDRLLVFAGSGMSALKLQWLKWLASVGSPVWLVCDRHAASTPLFEANRRALADLAGPGEAFAKPTGFLRRLFSDEASGDYDGIQVRVGKAPDSLAECEWVLRQCLAEGDASCTIFVRNLQTYAPLLESAAKRLRVPLRMTRRTPLLSNRFARLVSDLLAVCAGHDVRGLRPLLSSTYLQIGLSDQKRAHQAIREASRHRDQQWAELEKWSVDSGEPLRRLRDILSWRRRCAGASASLREWTQRLRELGDTFTDSPFGSSNLTERDARAQNALQKPLFQLASLEPEKYAEVDIRRFSILCRRLWADADVSVPPSTEGIPVTDQPEALGSVDSLFVMGMLEGIFPKRRTEDPILFDHERAEIARMTGSPWLEDSHHVARAERDAFYRVCAASNARIFLTYPEADEDQDNIPAGYLDEAARAAGTAEFIEWTRSALTPPIGDCVADADLLLAEALDRGPSQTATENILTTEAAKAAIRWSNERGISPRELSEAVRCPFRFFARRRLGIRPSSMTSRWGSLRRLPISGGLLRQSSKETALEAMLEALALEVEELSPDLAPWEGPLLLNGGRRLVEEWVEREFEARKIWPRSNLRGPVQFGEPPLRDHIPKADLTLSGVIPAVSTSGGYRVMHLYEQGEFEIGPSEEVADFLYYGLHFLAGFEAGQGTALEVESLTGTRTLYLLRRLAGEPMRSRVEDGLKVVDLADRLGHEESLRDFFDKLYARARDATKLVRSCEIEARPSAACTWCEYGELCRRSQQYNDEESPFD